MPNLPGFEEACELARSNRLLHHVGLHLVLRGAAPLTERIKNFPKLCSPEGQLNLARASTSVPIFHLEKPEKDALAEEIRAQIQRCRREGIPLTHADSHYHLHNEWAVAGVLIPILREQKIPYLRIARNCGGPMGLAKRLYKGLLNRKIRRAQLARTKYFGSAEDYIHMKRHRDGSRIGSMEIMIHPHFREKDGVLADDHSDRPLEEEIRLIDDYRQAVSFQGASLR